VSEHSTHAENFQKSDAAIIFHNAIIVVHMSTSISKKALDYIHNHHILIPEMNSS
jgi:hypothetical protein